MKLNEIAPKHGSRKKRFRIGRGTLLLRDEGALPVRMLRRLLSVATSNG